MWTKHKQYSKIIDEAWESVSTTSSHSALYSKMDHFEINLNLGVNLILEFGEILSLEEKLLKVQNTFHFDHCRNVDLQFQLDSILHKEDIFLRQSAKLHWLKDMDRNTSYFHNYARLRRRKNNITYIQPLDGSWSSNPRCTQNIFVQHFTNIFHETDISYCNPSD